LINFRYHIVSLMAVFLALAVGIVLGVTLRPSVDTGLAQQAAQDRKQVQDLRAELDRRNALDEYREAYATRAGQVLTAGVLNETKVAVVSMPDAPSAVVSAISAAVIEAGGAVTATVKVNPKAFDDEKSADLTAALSTHAGALGLTDVMPDSTKFGIALGRAVASKQPGRLDDTALDVAESLTSAGLIAIDEDGGDSAQLVIVVSAEATDPRPPPEELTAHVEMVVALRTSAAGVVLAGPNSAEIEGTDVLTARNDATAVDVLSTVDVADLTSGVTTTVLAGQEQLLGRQGHYGAFSKADAPLPNLPVR
jgi:Copper transport outer membrane protein, MctB